MELRDQLQRTLGGAYTLERELGGGGMSHVFLAEETALGRRVVVKVLPPRLTEGVNIERFKREIQVAARLQNPHIVPVLAAGETNGLPYYTMPFVEGESLRARLVRAGAMPIGEVITTLRDVALALTYAHDRGVVHRDIKPDNVMLTGGSAVVTDFGIAKAISASRTDPGSATLTQIGTSLGTPAYMAPEQAAGDPATDHRADMYAFGCMAYEMLTGQPPFVEKSPQQLLAAHMARPPEPVTSLRADTPPALAALVMRCLDKSADRRPASAAEVVHGLATVTSGGGHSVMPAILASPGALKRALAIWAVGVIVVAILAKAAVAGIGLPDWVFPGAMLVMALGLPVILFTGYVQRVTRHALTMTPTHTPGGTATAAPQGTMAGIAMKASPHMSWRRTTLGGAWAVGAFVLLVGAFMLLRALGIGPAGSLLAAGRINAREPILVTDFTVSNADSSLGRVLSDATKATLSQSSVITLLSPEAVGAALARMERPRTSTLDLALARELATREGIKAIVDGQVNGLSAGAGYIVALRLVTVDSLKELASFRESAKDAQGLIEVIDKLSRQLRGRVGESLRAVNRTPSLARVTTSSFAALQKYTEGDRAEAIETNRPKAIALLQEAVAIDSTFAEAWRRLGLVMTNNQRPRSQIDAALSQAYRFRDRTSDIERLLIEAAYFGNGPGRDRPKSIAAYEELVRRGHWRSANNLALRLTTRREFARAESVYRIGIREGDMVDRPLVLNPLRPLFSQQKFAAAESIIVRAQKLYPDLRGAPRARIDMLYMRGDTANYRRAVDSVATRGDSLDKVWARTRRVQLAVLAGRPRESFRIRDEGGRPPVSTLTPRQRLDRALAISETWVRISLLNEAEADVRELDATLTALRVPSLPEPERPYFGAGGIVTQYAWAGRADRARAALAEYDASVRDSALRLDLLNDRHAAVGEILLAEGKPLEAIEEFRRADRLPDGPANSCTLCLSHGLARAFDAAGMTDSAIVNSEQVISEYYPYRMIEGTDPLLKPIFLKRLGELYESKRDYAKAADRYRQFIALWANAEPQLQPLVEDARSRVRRLADTEGRVR